MIQFYDVDLAYINYLKQFDNQIPDISYSSDNKFVCGVVLNISDLNYANLLQTEYDYCRKHETDILAKANRIYKIGCNKKHVLNYACCDFQKLEQAVITWENQKSAKQLVGAGTP